MTGQPLGWKVVSGTDARKAGFAAAQADTDYLQVKWRDLAPGNEYRIRIDKTYQDPRTYFTKDGVIVLTGCSPLPQRHLCCRRVMRSPCNYPVQVMMEQDGRIKLSFLNVGNAGVPLHLEARNSATANLL